MHGHIRAQDWIDLAEGSGDEAQRRHLEACAACRRTREGLRWSWDRARAVDVPEPPPLYWEGFRRRLRQRLAEDGAHSWRDRARAALASYRWALAATMAVVLLLSSRVPHRTGVVAPAPSPSVLAAWSPLPSSEDDPGAMVLLGLAATEDLTPAVCTDLQACLYDLSEEEHQQLAARLQVEMKGHPL